MRRFVRENWWILIDAAFVIGLAYVTWQGWRGFAPTPAFLQQLSSPEERGLSLQSVSSGVTGAITGASIILGVIGAIAGLGQNLPSKTRAHLRFGAADCGFSLLVGVWTATVLPQYVSQNLSLLPIIGVALALQGYAMFAAMGRLFFGTWHIFVSDKGIKQ